MLKSMPKMYVEKLYFVKARSSYLELMLEHADQASLHDLKHGLAGKGRGYKTPALLNMSQTGRERRQRRQRRLNNLERAHYGNSYNKLTNLFGQINKHLLD